MSVTELFIDGLKLMLLGMGSVFSFLVILVVAMLGMSRLARALGGRAEIPVSSPVVDAGNEGELIAVISAAIQHYRSHKS